MTKRQQIALHKRITAGIEAAISRLYKEAKKNKWELVISEKGKIKKIRPA